MRAAAALILALILAGCDAGETGANRLAESAARAAGSAVAVDDAGYARRAEAPRYVYAETLVGTPVGEVFTDWTTAEGLQSFFAVEAHVELEANGRFDVWFMPDAEPGQRGSDGSKVLGFQKNRMLSATWVMPPYMPEINPHHTFIQVWFDDLGEDGTRVRLYHHGFGDGPAWDEGYDYFAKAWPQVMDAYSKHAAGEA